MTTLYGRTNPKLLPPALRREKHIKSFNEHQPRERTLVTNCMGGLVILYNFNQGRIYAPLITLICPCMASLSEISTNCHVLHIQSTKTVKDTCQNKHSVLLANEYIFIGAMQLSMHNYKSRVRPLVSCTCQHCC